jgi:hypothetical protein
MEIQINQEVIDTVCNSLRASKQSLRNQLRHEPLPQNKKNIMEHQLADVEAALRVFEYLES